MSVCVGGSNMKEIFQPVAIFCDSELSLAVPPPLPHRDLKPSHNVPVQLLSPPAPPPLPSDPLPTGAT